MRRFAMRPPVPTCPASTSSALGRETGTRPHKRKTGCRVTLNGVACAGGGLAADSASEVGTPSSVLSKVRAQPLTVRASAIRPTRAIERVTDLLEKKGARRERRAPKLARLHPDGSLQRDV